MILPSQLATSTVDFFGYLPLCEVSKFRDLPLNIDIPMPLADHTTIQKDKLFGAGGVSEDIIERKALFRKMEKSTSVGFPVYL